jgi:hypothetical protein
VLAGACSAEVTTGAGKFRTDALAAKVPKRAWQKLPAGADSKGHRFYDWAVTEARKGLAGLDEHQLRRFTSWSGWVTLAMLAHAFRAVIRADEHTRHPPLDGLIPLTCNEIQRLFTMLVVQPVPDVAHWLACPPGDVATRPEPRPAITGGKPRIRREDHDLWLEY